MIRVIFAIFCALMSYSTSAVAQDVSDVVDVRILPGWRTADGGHMAALQIDLREGWKTYWRAPGDAGIPPRFDWRRSRNLADVDMIWPTPSVSVDYGIRTIGYKNQLVLPMRLTPQRTGRDLKLDGIIEIGVCREVCIPVELRVSADLSRAQTKPDPKIAAALASRPYSASEAGVTRVACRMTPAHDGIGLRAEVDVPTLGGVETTVVEVNDPQIWVAHPKMNRQGRRLIVETKLQHVEGRSFALDRSAIRITVLGRSHAVDIQGCPAG